MVLISFAYVAGWASQLWRFLESRYRHQQAVVDSPLPNPVRHQAEEHTAIVAAIEVRDADAAVRTPAHCPEVPIC